MCHILYIASPLTLSEIRSMLPDGLAADLLPPTDAAILLRLLPSARTAARLLAGACSCDLFLERDPETRGEEAELRRRYRAAGLSRAGVIRALERHRGGAASSAPTPRAGHQRRRPERWAGLVAAFVAEHARNAGATLFYRHVTFDGLAELPPVLPALEVPVTRVVAAPADWLAENQPTIVVRTSGATG